jgi:hypothetical protein
MHPTFKPASLAGFRTSNVTLRDVLKITIRPRVSMEYRARAKLLRVAFLLAQDSFPASLDITNPYDPSNDPVFIGGAMLVDRR